MRIFPALPVVLAPALIAGAVGCTGAAPANHPPPTSEPAPTERADPAPSVVPVSMASALPATSASAAAKIKDPPVAREGEDFIEQARVLYRIAACGGDAPVPAAIEKIVADHCALLVPRIAAYRSRWLDVARPFLAKLVPADAPKQVVYPFAGGDNSTMLVTYPNADEYTSISLELAGDARKVQSVSPRSLAGTLAKLRRRLDELIGDSEFSQSETLQKMMIGEIPFELSFLMVGLVVHDLEPVSLRYFRLEPDGAIHYFTAEEIAKLKAPARRRSQTWGDGDFSEAFANAEIAFKPRGHDGPVRVQRHIAFNLDNQHVKADPSLLAHLDKKGEVSLMIKASSYLLWGLNFTRTRDYILHHAQLIVSDSTAPLPKDAEAAGYRQTVWGKFRGARIPVIRAAEKAMIAFWASQPEQPIPFRFGYLDKGGAPHLMLTTRQAAQAR